MRQDLGMRTTLAAAPLISDPHRCQIGGLAPAEAEFSTPSEKHAGDDPVRAGNL